MIFMGEEWAASSPFLYFTDHQDPALQKLVIDGRRQEFGGSAWADNVPDPQAIDTFQRSKLNWQERCHAEHSDMLGWYTELLRLRRSLPDFHPSRFHELEVVADSSGTWLWMKRGPYQVVASLVNGTVETPLPVPANASLLMQAGSTGSGTSGRLTFIGPGVLILKQDRRPDFT